MNQEPTTMERHFITFYSTGRIVSVVNQELIDKWDVDLGMMIAKAIKKRRGVAPYGFRFSTRARKDDELDSKEIKKSNMYYLGGKVSTLDQGKKIIENYNSWKYTAPLYPEDVVLEFSA